MHVSARTKPQVIEECTLSGTVMITGTSDSGDSVLPTRVHSKVTNTQFDEARAALRPSSSMEAAAVPVIAAVAVVLFLFSSWITKLCIVTSALAVVAAYTAVKPRCCVLHKS